MEIQNLDIVKLNQLYKDSEEVDKSHFTKMRSNVLLSAGEHYTKNVNKHFSRLRETNKLAPTTKLRLTKNHIYRIVKMYTNSIISKAPGVRPMPKNEMEMQDQKSAELNNAVWTDLKERHKLKDKQRKWCEHFTSVGEFALKVFWDPDKGEHIGYEPLVDDLTGEPQLKMKIDDATGEPAMQQVGVDEFGQPILEPIMEQVADETKAVMSGDLCYEIVPAYNLLRSPECKDMELSDQYTIRKLIGTKLLEAKYANDPDKLKHIQKGREDEFVVFDSNSSSYRKTKEETMLREMYFSPCKAAPLGWYYHFTEYGILERGPIPFGLYPIVWVGFDEYVSTPRANSIISVARPYQAEVNRAASQEATHQVTLGDDKILYQQGSKLSQGALLPGVRGVSYNGAPPTILPGRTGAQFGDYTQRTITEMYHACLLDEATTEKALDAKPNTLLFRSIAQKAVFTPYIEKWERFLCDVAELSLDICRNYLPDQALIYAIGRNEQINIPEFRSTTKFCYRMTMEPISDDAETMLGKQINFENILQYLGSSLDPSTVGKILNNMPYVNNEDSFSDLTIDEDNVKNDMMSIERGENPQLGPDDDNVYYIKKLGHRMKQADFKFLSPQVQQLYAQFKQSHQKEEMRKAEEIKRAQAGFIPIGGPMVAVDMYVEADDPTKQPKRARVFQKSLNWLFEQMEIQGDTLEQMESMDRSSLAQLAEMMNGNPGVERPQQMQVEMQDQLRRLQQPQEQPPQGNPALM